MNEKEKLIIFHRHSKGEVNGQIKNKAGTLGFSHK